METKAIIKGKTLSVQVQADETKSSVLCLENLLINDILQENRMQGSIEIKCLKTKNQPTDVLKSTCNTIPALIQNPLAFCVKICQPLSLKRLPSALTPAKVQSLKGWLCFPFSESVHRSHLTCILQGLNYLSVSELTKRI